MMTDLTAPITLGSVTAANRIALAPMTNKQSHPDGTLSGAEIAWLAQRARGGFGTVITGAYAVAPEGRVWHGQAGVYAAAHQPALARLARELVTSGSVGIVQLIHGGARFTPQIARAEGVSASAGPTWRQATETDIQRLLLAHRTAALRVESAGLHGVEVHAAHGYLPAQFLSRTQNLRTDGWGGSLPGRARFLRETVRTIRASVGDDVLIGVRLSPEDERHGIDIDETAQVAGWLAEDGANYLHLSLRPALAYSQKHPAEHPLDVIKRALPWPVPVMAAGGIWTPQDARQVMELGADLVAIGQAAIYNPDWAAHAAEQNWEPGRPPLTVGQLAQVGVTTPFAEYLRAGWPGSVA